MNKVTTSRGFGKGAARLSIEAALKNATAPLSAWQISDLTGVEIRLARTHIGNCVNQRMAYNVHPKECPPGAYLWGQPEVVAAPNVAPGRTLVVGGTYTGEPAKAQRPGAMDAYSLPSLHQGERIARKAPMLIGSIG